MSNMELEDELAHALADAFPAKTADFTTVDEGRKDDVDKVRMELVPPEMVFAVAKVLTFGADKYAETYLERICHAMKPDAVDLFTAGDYVARITRKGCELTTPHTRNDKGRTAEIGGVGTGRVFASWRKSEKTIRERGFEMPRQSDAALLNASVLPSRKLMNTYEDAARYVEAEGTFGSITITKAGSSEVFCATVATSASEIWATLLTDCCEPSGIFARPLNAGARNWEKGMSWGRVFGALMRHLWCWWGGKGPTTKSFLFGDLDDETGYSHLWHAGCCIAFLIAYEERGVGEDDRLKAPSSSSASG